MSNKYCHKNFLQDVKREHPPKDQQLVDNRLRLHRAERLECYYREPTINRNEL